MKKAFLKRNAQLASQVPTALAVILAFASIRTQAQILLSYHATVQEYGYSGALVNSEIIAAPYWNGALGLDGSGNVFVVQDGHRISKYTSTGSLRWSFTAAEAGESGSQFSALALLGDDLFVTDYAKNRVLRCSATDAAAILNPNFVVGLNGPVAIAATASGLFVVNHLGTQSISTPWGLIADGLNNPQGIAIAETGEIFVVNNGNGTVAKYAHSGQLMSASLISGLQSPVGIAVDRAGSLFVVSGSGIGQYTTEGEPVNPMLIPIQGVTGIAIKTVPEPTAGLLFGLAALLASILRQRQP